MIDERDSDNPSGSDAEGLEPWERNRRLRLAQIEAENEHGKCLAERYGRDTLRQRFALVGHADAKRRRRR